MTTIVLVRHGQTMLNRGKRIRGQLDPPLDETGIRQAQRTAHYVASRWPVAAVYSSPLRRAIQTAEPIASSRGLEPIPFEGLLDLDFGKWHGLSFEQTRLQFPELYEEWHASPHTVRFPDGETLDDVRSRAVDGIRQITRWHREQTVAMIGHTVVNRVIVCAVLGVSNEAFWRLGQETCAVNVIETMPSGKMNLLLLNGTSHLENASGS